MKRIICLILTAVMLVSLCACGASKSKDSSEATLVFVAGDVNVSEKLSDEDAAKIISILDGNSLSNLHSGTPSCSFDEKVAIKIGSRTYAIALDGCAIVMEMRSQRYFNIAEEDMAFIHSVFEKLGGFFPCV